MKYLAYLIIVFILLGCNNNDNFNDFETVRKCNIQLNDKAATALNEITKLLNGDNAIYNQHEDSSLAKITKHYVYFNLTDYNGKLFIRTVLWNNYAQTGNPIYVDYELPIKNIDITNIELIDLYLPAFGGEYSSFEIYSKFNNHEAFGVRVLKFDENKQKYMIKSTKTGNILLQLKRDIARKLKEQLIIFVQNYNE